jgi:glutathione synthase/RimK-type ligase-like ATP-grasp enzyme
VDVALATCKILPEPDPDEAPLLEALAAADIDAQTLAWDDPEADFSSATLTILRSTWNYPWYANSFREWTRKTASVTTLINPLSVVQWNLHKRYLLELADRGIPVAPTALLQPPGPRALADVLSQRGWHDVVIKPAVSAGSYRTMRCTPDNRDAGQAHLDLLMNDGEVLIQPYLHSVDDHGERALVWIDGKFTHAVRKNPRLSGQDEAVDPTDLLEAEVDLARRTLATIDGPLLYARVDVARDSAGQPVVMELELIEPSLFFTYEPEAVRRFVRAVQRRLTDVTAAIGRTAS